VVTLYDTRFGSGLTANEKDPGCVCARALTLQPGSLLRFAFAHSAMWESVIRSMIESPPKAQRP